MPSAKAEMPPAVVLWRLTEPPPTPAGFDQESLRLYAERADDQALANAIQAVDWLTDEQGVPLHGTYQSQPLHTDGPLRRGVVVACGGVPLASWTVPAYVGRLRSERLTALNIVLSQIPWWALDGSDRLLVTRPSDATVDLVVSGHKPAGLADTRDSNEAHAWVKRAREARLDFRVECVTFEDDLTPVHFVNVAQQARLMDLFDRAAVVEEYRAAGVGRGTLGRIDEEMRRLSRRRLIDVLEEPDLISMNGPQHAEKWVRTGLVLGYLPATTASIIQEIEDGIEVGEGAGWSLAHVIARRGSSTLSIAL